MKTFLTILITAIVAAGIAVGCVFLIQGANKKNEPVPDKNNTSYSVKYLQKEYDVGDDIVCEFCVFSDIQFTSLTYKLNNGEEREIPGIKTGESEKHADYTEGVGKYFADTKVQVISTEDFSEGYYTLVVFGYDKDGNRYEITESPYSFKLNAVASEAPAEEAA